MSTEYFLRTMPESSLNDSLSIKCRQSLIRDHNLNLLSKIVLQESKISDETIKVINRGVRGPYSNGSLYCGFNFNEEIAFWKTLLSKFPENAWLNMIYADYLVQFEKGFHTAHEFYQKAFNINYRLIFALEPSWRDELIETNFVYELYYLKTQKENYESEDFKEIVDRLTNKYKNNKAKLNQIGIIAKTM